MKYIILAILFLSSCGNKKIRCPEHTIHDCRKAVMYDDSLLTSLQKHFVDTTEVEISESNSFPIINLKNDTNVYKQVQI